MQPFKHVGFQQKKKKNHQQKTNRLENVKGNNFRVTSYNFPSPFLAVHCFWLKNILRNFCKQMQRYMYIYIYTHLFTEYSKQEITLDCWIWTQTEQRGSCFCFVFSFYTYVYSNQCYKNLEEEKNLKAHPWSYESFYYIPYAQVLVKKSRWWLLILLEIEINFHIHSQDNNIWRMSLRRIHL